MIKINIVTNYNNWKNYLPNPDNFIQKRVKNLNRKFYQYKKNIIFFTLLLSGNNKIKKLNKKFRNKDRTTDVLSFPFYNKRDLKIKLKKEKEIYLGDIIINLNKIRNKNDKKNFKLEFNKLWIHGLVHLFGYDHKKNRDFSKMRKLEKKFLSYID
tara:strand:- start:2747 stop:3211 length:465 start_codon:yes stop_codon:yes gene_type:complete